jgi:transposase
LRRADPCNALDCETISGNGSRIFCRAVKATSAATQRTIGCFVEAVLYRYRTGIPWRDLPARFGDWKIVHQRFGRWAKSGVFERIFKLLASDHDNEYMMLDATIVRAHQHSAGARKKMALKPSADRAVD